MISNDRQLAFIRMPTEETEWDELHTSPLFTYRCGFKTNEGNMTGLIIDMRLRDFEKTGNPIFAMEAFVLAVEMGVYPPLPIIRFVADSLKHYHDEQGFKSLDEAFGVSTKRGGTKPFKKLGMDARDDLMMHMMDVIRVLGGTIDQAAEAVSLWFDGFDFKNRHSIKAIDADTIANRYKNSKRTIEYLDGQIDERQAAEFVKDFKGLGLPNSHKWLNTGNAKSAISHPSNTT